MFLDISWSAAASASDSPVASIESNISWISERMRSPDAWLRSAKQVNTAGSGDVSRFFCWWSFDGNVCRIWFIICGKFCLKVSFFTWLTAIDKRPDSISQNIISKITYQFDYLVIWKPGIGVETPEGCSANSQWILWCTSLRQTSRGWERPDLEWQSAEPDLCSECFCTAIGSSLECRCHRSVPIGAHDRSDSVSEVYIWCKRYVNTKWALLPLAYLCWDEGMGAVPISFWYLTTELKSRNPYEGIVGWVWMLPWLRNRRDNWLLRAALWLSIIWLYLNSNSRQIISTEITWKWY